MLYKIKRYAIHKNNQVDFLPQSELFFAQLNGLIENAKYYIHFQIYIFNYDETGKQIANYLKIASQRGVKIYLVLDAYGTNNLPDSFITYLKSFCTVFKFFSPLLLNKGLHFGLRLHHKIITADGDVALMGGINIANKYSGINYQNRWLDFGIQIRGNAVKDLEIICNKIINRNVLKANINLPVLVEPNFAGNTHVRILQNDRFRNKLGITRSYRRNIRDCKNSLLIVSSYFLPSNSFRRILKNAAKRGVKINLILGEVSDTKLVLNATKYFYKSLLIQGIEIYEWQNSVLHGKLAVFDEKITTIGSYNLNSLSDFGSIECNAEIIDANFSKHVVHVLNQDIISVCKKVDANTYNLNLSWYKTFWYWLNYFVLIQLLGFLFFLQKENAKEVLEDTVENEF